MKKKGLVFILLGLALILSALGITGYNLYDTQRAGRSAGETVEKLLEKTRSFQATRRRRPGNRRRPPSGRSPITF